MDFYTIIPKTFAENMFNKESPINKNSYFGYRITKDGRYATSINSIIDFPDDFGYLMPITLIFLSIDDFPQSEPI